MCKSDHRSKRVRYTRPNGLTFHVLGRGSRLELSLLALGDQSVPTVVGQDDPMIHAPVHGVGELDEAQQVLISSEVVGVGMPRDLTSWVAAVRSKLPKMTRARVE
jgi:hypothetical protein